MALAMERRSPLQSRLRRKESEVARYVDLVMIMRVRFVLVLMRTTTVARDDSLPDFTCMHLRGLCTAVSTSWCPRACRSACSSLSLSLVSSAA